MLTLPGPLVSAAWLQAHFDHPDLRLLDASWFLPGAPQSGEALWLERRLPGARFFDFDGALKAPDSALPHMLPAPDRFAEELGKLGILAHHTLVFYDSSGVFASPRGWWMCRAMGHERVAVLDGGLPAWLATGGALEKGAPAEVTPTSYPVPVTIRGCASLDDLRRGVGQVLDARSPARFAGQAPEPRPGVRSGRMPGALNLPFDALLREGRFKPQAELVALFEELVADPDTPLVFSCGSGVTACILALGASLAGREDWAVYDGSWAEWGSRDDCPVERD